MGVESSPAASHLFGSIHTSDVGCHKLHAVTPSFLLHLAIPAALSKPNASAKASAPGTVETSMNMRIPYFVPAALSPHDLKRSIIRDLGV